MPTVICLTRNASLFTEVESALQGGPDLNDCLVISCESVSEGLAALENLLDPFVWVLDATLNGIGEVPADHPQLMLVSNSLLESLPRLPSLELPLRPSELQSWIRHLNGRPPDVPAPSATGLPGAEDLNRITHDLNNRLTTVTGYVSLLPDLLPPEESEMIEEMENALREAESLIRSLQQD